MIEFNAQVTNSGRVTIPTKLRQKHDIKEGDHVQVQISKLAPQKEA